MNPTKRIVVGLLYSLPAIAFHTLLIYLYRIDPGTSEVIKKVGYTAIGIYYALFLLLCSMGIAAMTLISLKYLFKIKLKAEITED